MILTQKSSFFLKELKEQSTMTVKKEKKEVIKGIEQVKESEELVTSPYFVCSLTVTEDGRIASRCQSGSISISSYDVENKTWEREIHKKDAHNGSV